MTGGLGGHPYYYFVIYRLYVLPTKTTTTRDYILINASRWGYNYQIDVFLMTINTLMVAYT